MGCAGHRRRGERGARRRVAGVGAILLGWTAVAGVSACAEEPPRPSPARHDPPVDSDDPGATNVALVEEMRERYETATAMRGALERGDLAATQVLARQLRPVTARLPPPGDDLRDPIPERARVVSNAESLEEGGRAFGILVAGCGECHRLVNSEWEFPTPAVVEGNTLGAHMRRHQWAVDRMWEALLTADRDRFARGAEALSEAPLTRGDPSVEGGTPDVARLAGRVHALAGEAAELDTFRDRGALFGELLATCGACHRHFEALDGAGAN